MTDIFPFPKLELQARLQETNYIIIKLGTGILTPHIESQNQNYFLKLAEVIQKLKEQGNKVLLVSSGAVGFGREIIKKNQGLREPLELKKRQALASVGQSVLIENYRKSFAKFGLTVGQILVTRLDLASRTHYRNLKNTLDQLLEWNCVPIINENDPVAVSELRLGDNDTLSAQITAMYPQALLILLTTVDYFYSQGKPVFYLNRVSVEHFREAGGASKGGTGGMRTKLLAAERVLLAGQIMVIASGKDPFIVLELLQGEPKGTWFFNLNSRELPDRKRWLIHQKHSAGKIFVDSGAAMAIKQNGASLLVVGIQDFLGNFEKNDVVDVFLENKIIARGLVTIDHSELKELLNKKQSRRGVEVIHRDNLVILSQ